MAKNHEKTSKIDWHRIAEEWASGTTFKELSHKYSVSASIIRYQLTKRGLYVPKPTLDWNYEKAEEMYRKGSTPNEISSALSVPVDRIYRHLVSRGLHRPQRRSIPYWLDRAVELRKEGLNISEIGRLLAVGPNTVRDHLINAGIHVPRKNLRYDIDRVMTLGEGAASTKDIAAVVNKDHETVSSLLMRRDKRSRDDNACYDLEDIRELLETGVTYEKIGEKYGVTKSAVSSYIERMGLPLRGRKPR